MSANISDWLMEGIDASTLETKPGTRDISVDDAYNYYNYSNYTVYSQYNDYYNTYYDYYNYSVYYDYYNYSVYYDYYNYSNYSNSISVTSHPISQTVRVGETVTFSVAASNTIDSCQWYYADSPTSAGTAITGATSPTYSFTALEMLDSRYYYCVVKRGGNSSTSSRALLTIMTLRTFDVCLAVGDEFQIMLIRPNPSTTTIDSVTSSDPNVASVTNSGLITAKSPGRVVFTIVGSNGVTSVSEVVVIMDPLVAVLTNLGIATRAYTGLNSPVHLNQIPNAIRGITQRASYSTLEDLFTDLADAIRSVGGTTEAIKPVDFYNNILSLI